MAGHKGQHWIPAAAYLKAWTDPDVPADHEPFVHVFCMTARNIAGERRQIFSKKPIYIRSRPATDLAI